MAAVIFSSPTSLAMLAAVQHLFPFFSDRPFSLDIGPHSSCYVPDAVHDRWLSPSSADASKWTPIVASWNWDFFFFQYIACSVPEKGSVRKIRWDLPRGCSLKKNLRTLPKKNPKNPKKIPKIQEFFWGFEIRTPYLGVKKSVLKSFSIY